MVRIPDGGVLDGSLPIKQVKLVQAWVAIHQDEPMADWLLASEGQTPIKINLCVESKSMTPDVVEVKAYQETVLKVEFTDGSICLFDMKPLLQYPAFFKLRDNAFFLKAQVQHSTVVWDEEIDISPDTLYMRG